MLLKYYEDFTNANKEGKLCNIFNDQIRRVKLRIQWIEEELSSEPQNDD